IGAFQSNRGNGARVVVDYRYRLREIRNDQRTAGIAQDNLTATALIQYQRAGQVIGFKSKAGSASNRERIRRISNEGHRTGNTAQGLRTDIQSGCSISILEVADKVATTDYLNLATGLTNREYLPFKIKQGDAWHNHADIAGLSM